MCCLSHSLHLTQKVPRHVDDFINDTEEDERHKSQLLILRQQDTAQYITEGKLIILTRRLILQPAGFSKKLQCSCSSQGIVFI